MSTPHNSYSDADPSFDLVKRITQRLQQGGVNNQILEILQQAVEKEFDKNHILLSRPEKIRLYRLVTKAVLTDMLAKIGGDK